MVTDSCWYSLGRALMWTNVITFTEHYNRLAILMCPCTCTICCIHYEEGSVISAALNRDTRYSRLVL